MFVAAIECMQKNCSVQVPEDFAFRVIMQPKLRQKYEKFAFIYSVQCHPELAFCPGQNCDMIVQAAEVKAKRVTCKCGAVFWYVAIGLVANVENMLMESGQYSNYKCTVMQFQVLE